jgi:tetratricopeptide (TPR) repeat protein
MPIEATSADRTRVNLFYSYAPEDEPFCRELEKQLSPLQQQSAIAPWNKASIRPGTNWQQEITVHLNTAQLILLLISPDFLASDFYDSKEMKQIFEKYARGEVWLIPIILRPCDWQGTAFGKLQSLPAKGIAVTEWPNRDSAFFNIAQGIRLAIQSIPQQLQQPSSTLPTTPKVFTIPFARNPYFTGREDILNHLHNALHNNKTAALTQAIAGLGGIGKTQTAVEYAYRHQDDYQHIFWVRAEKREELNSDLAALATSLNLPEKDEQDQPRVIAAVQKWLATHTGWLLVLDNADDPAVVKECLPSPLKGHIILTTRAQILGRLAQRIEIEKMGLEEGTRFLLHRANIIAASDASLDTVSSKDIAKAKEIVQTLDGLPLALEQAAAYIEENECGLAGYLQRYQIQRNLLFQYRGDFISEHPEPISTTWKLSFSNVEQANPAAADLLRLCAFLAPDAIPEEIVTKGARHLGPSLQPVASDTVKLDAAIKELRKYSLVKRDPDSYMLNMHRLVQAVLKDEMSEEMQQQWAERAVRAVAIAFPNVRYETWPECERVLPHARVCVQWIEQWQMEFAEVGRLLNQTGWYLRERLLYTEAEPLLQQSLTLPEHPYLTSSLNNLAMLYYAQGKYGQAEPLLQQALAIDEKAYGLEHPDVATSLNNLAMLYKVQGKYEQAEPLLQRAVAIREKVLEPEHPDVATSLNNLAVLYQAQGKYAQAEPLYQRVQAILEKVYSSEHPNIAYTLNNLAGLYKAQGKYAQAEVLYQRSLKMREKILGLEHISVARVLKNYADLLRKTNREDEATKLEERAQAIRAKHAQENPTTND